MPCSANVGQGTRAHDADTEPVGVPHAVILHTPAVALAQHAPERLRRAVVVRIVKRGSGFAQRAQVVQGRVDIGSDQPHVEIDRRLGGSRHEQGAVMADLGQRRFERLRRVVHAVAAIREA